jgi:hypothetical protein
MTIAPRTLRRRIVNPPLVATRPMAIMRRRSISRPNTSIKTTLEPTTTTATAMTSTGNGQTRPLVTPSNHAGIAHDLYNWLVCQGTSMDNHPTSMTQDKSRHHSPLFHHHHHHHHHHQDRSLSRRPHAQFICDNLKQIMPAASPVTAVAWQPMDETESIMTSKSSDLSTIAAAAAIASGSERPRISFLSPIEGHGDIEPSSLSSDISTLVDADTPSDLQRYLRIDVEVLSSHLVQGLPK